MTRDQEIAAWMERGEKLFASAPGPMFAVGVWWAERPFGKRFDAMAQLVEALEDIAEGPEQWTADGMAQIAKSALARLKDSGCA